MGLDLLPQGGTRVPEIGVGSGILVCALTQRYARYVGMDGAALYRRTAWQRADEAAAA